MTNFIVLVGRLKEIREKGIVLEVRTPKNETLTTEVEISTNIMENSSKYWEVGDLVGIKGYIEKGNVITAERVTFLSNKERD